MLEYILNLFRPKKAKPPEIDPVIRSLQTAKKYFQDAESSDSQKDINNAISFATAAVLTARNTRHHMLGACYAFRGRCHQQNKNYAQEIEDYLSAYQLQKLPIYLYKIGKAYFNMRQLATARKYMIAAMALDHDGLKLMSQHDSFINEWILCEKNFEAMTGSNVISQNEKTIPLPLKQFVQIKDKSRFDQATYTNSAALLARSKAYQEMNRYQEALDDLDVCAWMKLTMNQIIDPRLAEIYHARMLVNLELQSYDRAYTDFQLLIQQIDGLSHQEVKLISWLNLEEIAKTSNCKIKNPAFCFALGNFISASFTRKAVEIGDDLLAKNNMTMAFHFYRIAFNGLLEIYSDKLLSLNPRLVSLSCDEKMQLELLESKDSTSVIKYIRQYQDVFTRLLVRQTTEIKASEPLNSPKSTIQQLVKFQPSGTTKPQWLIELKKEEQAQAQIEKQKEKERKKQEAELEKAEAEKMRDFEKQQKEKARLEKIAQAAEIREQTLKNRKEKQLKRIRHAQANPNNEVKLSEGQEKEVKSLEQTIQRARLLLKENKRKRSSVKDTKTEGDKIVVTNKSDDNSHPSRSVSPLSIGLENLFESPRNATLEVLPSANLIPLVSPELNTPPLKDDKKAEIEEKEEKVDIEVNVENLLSAIKVDTTLNRVGKIQQTDILELILAELRRSKRPDGVYLAFMTGGTLRNMQAGIKLPTDPDYTTNASPTEVVEGIKKSPCLKISKVKCYETPLGTLTVIHFHNHEKIDVVSSLILQNSEWSVMKRVTMETFRRNFTVNSMLLDHLGNLYSPNPESIKDAMNRQIIANRTDPAGIEGKNFLDLFQRDPLSMLLYINLTHQFGNNVCDANSFVADAIHHFAPLIIKQNQPFKIHETLDKLFTNGHATPNFLAMVTLGVLQVMLPEVTQTAHLHHQWIVEQLEAADDRFRRTGKCSINRIYMIFIIAAVAGDLSQYEFIPQSTRNVIEANAILSLNFSGCTYTDSLRTDVTNNLLDYIARGIEFRQMEEARMAEQKPLPVFHNPGTFFNPNATWVPIVPELQTQNIIQQSLNHNQ